MFDYIELTLSVVFGDDRVTYYTGGDDVSWGVGDTYSWRGASVGNM